MPEFRSVFVRAPAKINLFLRILAKEDTGYHQIETLFAAVGLYDELHLDRTDGGVSVDVMGPAVGPEKENLAYRAARALLERRDGRTGYSRSSSTRCPEMAVLTKRSSSWWLMCWTLPKAG